MKDQTENKLLIFLEKLPMAHALARTCECKNFLKFSLKPPVLSLGCGDGIFDKICFGKIDVGVDINEKEIKQAKKLGVYQKLIIADATSLPFPNESFNTVISNSTFEHIKEIEKVFPEANRVLKKKGQLIFTVPTPYVSNYYFFTKFFNKLKLKFLACFYSKVKNYIWQHINLKKEAWWKKKLKKAGFKNIKSYSFPEDKVDHFCDIFLFLEIPSFLLKKITGQWFFWRPKWVNQLLVNYFGKFDLGKAKNFTSATYIFQAIK